MNMKILKILMWLVLFGIYNAAINLGFIPQEVGNIGYLLILIWLGIYFYFRKTKNTDLETTQIKKSDNKESIFSLSEFIKNIKTPNAVIISAILLAISIIISPIALEHFKFRMCINAGYLEAFCINTKN